MPPKIVIPESKSETIQFRLHTDEKKRLQAAARRARLTLSEFVLGAARARASRTP